MQWGDGGDHTCILLWYTYITLQQRTHIHFLDQLDADLSQVHITRGSISPHSQRKVHR
jgi:hypothetical protein